MSKALSPAGASPGLLCPKCTSPDLRTLETHLPLAVSSGAGSANFRVQAHDTGEGARGAMINPRVRELCREFEIRIVDKHRCPDVGETRATETLVLRHGEAHLRLVLSTLWETANNAILLDEVGLWMASDMVRACERIIEERAGDWLETWDAITAGELQFICQDLAGVIPQRYALGGMVYERLYRRFGPNAAQMDLLDDRRRTPWTTS